MCNNKNEIYNIFDRKDILDKIIDFHQKNITKIHFFIPSIHCISCVFILENLHQKNKHIFESIVDFSRKKIWITFNNDHLKSSDLANILDEMGFKPSINFGLIDNKKEIKDVFFKKELVTKLAISFFCFGNIMLLSIPEYVGSLKDPWYFHHRYFFRYLMLILTIPIILFSLWDHIRYAIIGIKKYIINIDIPIILGLSVLFSWSCYEIFFDLGPGYFDSLSSFSLFLIISKLLQIHTNNNIIQFDKDYKSFYPILITKIDEKNGKEKKVILSSLKTNDIILIKNEEIIPTDSILMKGKAIMDNSFITGESYLVSKKIGDRIYAGSKQKGEAIYLQVIKNVDHSYLSILWNKNKCHNKKYFFQSLSNRFSKYFTTVVLLISTITGLYWYIMNDIQKIFQTTFSVLIITCPCALVLSTPMIFGSIIHIFSTKGFYIKDISTMEKITKLKTLIFDKTGTLTDPQKEKIYFIGRLNKYEKKMIASLLRNSIHPLSKKILSELSIHQFYPIKNFKEVEGKGLECMINNMLIKIGSPKYLNLKNREFSNNQTTVSISINKKFLGYFLFRNYYRKGITKIFQKLIGYKIIILSGDNNELEKKYLKSILPQSSEILFNQSPEKKMKYVQTMQKKGKNIIMFGDGINDCAALNISEVGVGVSDNTSNFYPNCDAFIKSSCLNKIHLFLKVSRISSKLVIANFLISIFYNLFGISFAVTGNLKPIIASILMPLSSISVICFSIISTRIISRILTF
ncbi:heavy metal translocating P-type ATPase [Blattabacterium cuenoti]|uniref:heavy metal translocating P-type ATPase n=1 Tax=Blattabacterium cuenoti TaxID=1653831 RepID=UPI00163D23B4|nr:HAD-IC family P-type ATPase [Blattabacterium cuenoti]